MARDRVVYFGVDECLRVPVLQHAGYEVIGCPTLVELMRALEAVPKLAAIVFGEESGQAADWAANVARERTEAALMLFAHPCSVSDEALFDRVVAPGTPPGQWLEHLSRTIWLGGRKGRPQMTAIRRIDGGAAADKPWSAIARDLQSSRRDKLEGAPDGLSDFRHVGRIHPVRRRWI